MNELLASLLHIHTYHSQLTWIRLPSHSHFLWNPALDSHQLRLHLTSPLCDDSHALDAGGLGS